MFEKWWYQFSEFAEYTLGVENAADIHSKPAYQGESKDSDLEYGEKESS